MKNILAIIIPISLLLILWLAYPFLFPLSENQKIENILKAAVSDFQDKNRKGVFSHTLKDLKFKPRGDIDEVVMQMKGFFFQVRELKASVQYIVHENKKLPRNATEASLIFVAKINGKIDGQDFQSFGNKGADAMKLKMKKNDNTWKVAEVEYLDVSNPLNALEQFKSE